MGMADTKLTVGRDDPHIGVMTRIPPEMHARLKSDAYRAGRSLNAEILHRLTQTLGEDFAAEQPAAQPVLAEMLAQMREQTGLLRDLVGLAREASSTPEDFRA